MFTHLWMIPNNLIDLLEGWSSAPARLPSHLDTSHIMCACFIGMRLQCSTIASLLDSLALSLHLLEQLPSRVGVCASSSRRTIPKKVNVDKFGVCNV